MLKHQTRSSIGRALLFVFLLLLIFLVAALATLFSSGATFLSIWLIVASLGTLGLLLLVFLPQPSAAQQRLAMPLLMAFVFTAVVWPRYATVQLPGMPTLSLSRICLMLFLLLGVYVVAKTPALRQRLGERIAQFRWVFYPLLLWLLLRFIGLPFSESPFGSLRGLLNESVTVYAPMFLALALINDRRDIHRVLGALALATVVVVALGIYEYTRGRNLFFGVLEIDSEYLQQVLRDKVRAGGYRLQSTFAHPLTLSEYLVFATPLLFYLTFAHGFRWWRSLLMAALMAGLLFVIIKTGSRSGIGGLALVLGLCAVLAAARLARSTSNTVAAALYVLVAVGFVMVAAIGLYLLMDIIVGRTTREFNSGMVRLQMWQVGLEKIAASPLLGFGQDTAAVVLGFVGSHGIITIDSYFLSVLLDGGVFALVLYMLALGALGVILLRAGYRRDALDLLSVFFFASLVGFSIVKVILSLAHNHSLFMTLVAVALAGVSMQAPARVRSHAHPVLRRGYAA